MEEGEYQDDTNNPILDIKIKVLSSSAPIGDPAFDLHLHIHKQNLIMVN